VHQPECERRNRNLANRPHQERTGALLAKFPEIGSESTPAKVRRNAQRERLPIAVICGL
jgi:hypothetical protein